jgi:RNA polymerase sigma-70 factor (ECF subfamily)
MTRQSLVAERADRAEAPGAPRDRLAAEERMTALHDENAPALMRFLLGMTRGERPAAEDLLQETMLRAWRHLDTLPPHEESTRRWLFTVARRIAIDAARSRQRRASEISLRDVSRLAVSEDTSEAALAAYAIRHAFRSLSDAHRRVLAELYVQGGSVDDIADRLGVPAGTVKSRAHYALRSLRMSLSAAD